MGVGWMLVHKAHRHHETNHLVEGEMYCLQTTITTRPKDRGHFSEPNLSGMLQGWRHQRGANAARPQWLSFLTESAGRVL